MGFSFVHWGHRGLLFDDLLFTIDFYHQNIPPQMAKNKPKTINHSRKPNTNPIASPRPPSSLGISIMHPKAIMPTTIATILYHVIVIIVGRGLKGYTIGAPLVWLYIQPRALIMVFSCVKISSQVITLSLLRSASPFL